MFYSHTFLARKGPLGTVWRAAHLQGKLKKSHVTATHIPSTVERIMYPEVPIALRISSHLLLGVVRIYEKKVRYLYDDCRVLFVSLRNVFLPVDVNLPEDASHAQFDAVTLPETFHLDAVDISFDDYGSQDSHLKSQDQITLKDRYHVEKEPYITITIDNDVTPEISQSEATPQRVIDPMEIDIPTQIPSPFNVTSRQTTEIEERFETGSTLPDIPNEIEIMRDYSDNNLSMLQPDETLAFVPNPSPNKNTVEKEADTPLLEHMIAPEMPQPQSPQPSGGPSSPPTNGTPVVSVTPPNLSLRPTPIPEQPPPMPEQPRRRQRQKRQLFDESLVLTNEFCRSALHDCSDLVKRRKKLPSSALEMWRFRNSKNGFSEPLISGMCAELQSLAAKDLMAPKSHLLLSKDPQPEPTAPDSTAVGPNDDIVVERLRSPDHDAGYDFRSELIPSPLRSTPQHSGGNAERTSSPGIPGSVSEPRFGTTVDTESDRGMFTGSTGMRTETPLTNFEGFDNLSTGLSDIPEFKNTRDSDALSFLEEDNNSPLDSQGLGEGETMSVRTRAVAQYLRNHSPLSKYSEGPTEELSLNNILEGRSRKLCARMFYETLVLKDYGLIDVKQDEPYGDIILKLTPTLSRTKI